MAEATQTPLYVFSWGNNSKRITMKGRVCRLLARGSMNSCLIEFENGQKEIVSRNALRKNQCHTPNHDHNEP